MKTNEFELIETSEFRHWVQDLAPKYQLLIYARLQRVKVGHFGDSKRFEGLIELRWANGLRVYGFIIEQSFFVAGFGGNKNGQSYDIGQAKKIRAQILAGLRSP